MEECAQNLPEALQSDFCEKWPLLQKLQKVSPLLHTLRKAEQVGRLLNLPYNQFQSPLEILSKQDGFFKLISFNVWSSVDVASFGGF